MNSLFVLRKKNKATSIDDARKECFLHHYLEDHHHAKWHSHAASESEEYALCHSQMTPTWYEKQGRRDKVLAVEKGGKPSGDTGLPDIAGDRPESRAYSQVAADRTLNCSPMPKLVNPLPQALPKECTKAANICAWVYYT